MRIILTADKSLLSTYRDNTFVGYLSSLPVGPIPEGIFRWFYPISNPIHSKYLSHPHLSLRQLQSILLNHFIQNKKSNISENVEIYIFHPDKIESNIQKGDLVLVSTMDPLGIGPATSSWKIIPFGTPYHVYKFWDLMNSLQKIKKVKPFTLIVGGAGAWQITKEDFLTQYKIDYLFLGEAERTLGITIEKIIYKQPLSRIILGELTQPPDFIPLIGSTTLSMIEISRGCGRMCRFCAPTQSGKMRSIPKSIILQSAQYMLNDGTTTLCLQSEDTLRYGSKNFNIDTDAVYSLYSDLFNLGIKKIFITHATLANIASEPDFMEKLTLKLNHHGHKYYGFQPGIESGSDRLMRTLMAGKFFPIIDMTWSEIVKDAFKLCDKYKWVPTASMMIGLPGENKDDLQETEALIDFLIQKDYLFIFAPLLFVPVSITPLASTPKPKLTDLSPINQRIWKKMWTFNITKLPKVWNIYNLNGYEFPHWKASVLAKCTNLIQSMQNLSFPRK